MNRFYPALAILLASPLCHAGVLDTFSRSGEIVGTSPDTGGGTYSGALGQFTDDGTRLQAVASSGHGTVGLPISIPTGSIVTAAVDIQLASPTDFNWLSLGFMSPDPADGEPDLGGPMYYLGNPWVFLRGLGNVEALANGKEFDSALTVTPGASTHVALVLDTRAPNWTVSLYVNGALDGMSTYAVNPPISWVGLGHDLAAGSFDNFSVSINSPEPASLSCLSLSPIFLLRRRKKMTHGQPTSYTPPG